MKQKAGRFNFILRYFLLKFFILSPVSAFCFSVEDAGAGISKFITAYDRISNKYLYAAVGLLMVTLPAIGKIRQGGGQMRPVMAKAVAFSLYIVNFVCIFFLAVHFWPETSSIIEFAVNLLKRIFG